MKSKKKKNAKMEIIEKNSRKSLWKTMKRERERGMEGKEREDVK